MTEIDYFKTLKTVTDHLNFILKIRFQKASKCKRMVETRTPETKLRVKSVHPSEFHLCQFGKLPKTQTHSRSNPVCIHISYPHAANGDRRKRYDCQVHWQHWEMAMVYHFAIGSSRSIHFMANVVTSIFRHGSGKLFLPRQWDYQISQFTSVARLCKSLKSGRIR